MCAAVGGGAGSCVREGNQVVRDRSVPTFLGIGAQKAGTTWLYQHLREHPDVWMPPEKELHYFDRSTSYPSPNNLATSSPIARMLGSQPWERPQMREGRRKLVMALRARDTERVVWVVHRYFGHYGDRWYRSLFRQAGAAAVTGEITPSYAILGSEDVAHMRAVTPSLRLIFMIRHPVDRAWSAIRFGIGKGRPDAAIEPSDRIIKRLRWAPMLWRGDYERTLDIFLQHFDRRQMLVGFYDAIGADPGGLLDGITEFFGIAPFDRTAIDNGLRVNPSEQAEMPAAVHEFLTETYEPMIERLAERFGSYAARWRNVAAPTTREGVATTLRPTIQP
jgi:hypothetical protein